MIDIVERKPVNTGVFFLSRRTTGDSSAAVAVSSGQMVLEPKHDLVVSHESSVAAGDITIPVRVFNDMLEAVAAQLETYRPRGKGAAVMVVGVADRPGQLIRAAGMMFLSPEGRVLLLRNASTGEWVFPGGAVQNGEDPAIVAIRRTLAETGYWAGHFPGHFISGGSVTAST